MIYRLIVLFLVAIAITPSYAQSQAGYELPPKPTYVILAPRKFRPGQVYQVSVSALRLVYKKLSIRVSVKHSYSNVNDEFSFVSETFTRPSTRILQLKIPETFSRTKTGSYWLHVRGSVTPEGGLLFENRTRLEFEPKKVSIFIQTSKLLYHQGQTVRFRIIPMKPNLLPEYSTMSEIRVVDPSGATIRVWYSLMTNAGGVIDLSYKLAKQVPEGTWKITALKDDFTYEKTFQVVEYWQRRFDVNVTMPKRLSEAGFGVFGLIMANHTSGRPVKGNATVYLQLKDPLRPNAPPVASTKKYINVFEGKSDFLFPMMELKTLPGLKGKVLENFEVNVTVTVVDWFLLLEYSGYAYSFIYPYKPEIKVLGGRVRPFKPGMPFTSVMILEKPDETEVKHTTNQFITLELFCNQEQSNKRSVDLNIPDDGVVQYTFIPSSECDRYRLIARYMERRTLRKLDNTEGNVLPTEINRRESYIFKVFSSSNSYLQISTSTPSPKVNEYMILNVVTNTYVKEIHYQIVAGGNIIFADRLEMTSNTMSKTFSIAVSRDMAPVARVIAFYVKPDGEVVADSLTLYINIERLNTVKVGFNRGKDFNVDEIEVNAYADPGAYIAFSAIPYDLFIHGGSTILQDYDLTDELVSYESHAQQPFNHTWYDDREILVRRYFPSPSMGADTNSTFNVSGLILFTDANFTKVNFYHECNETRNPSQALPCYSYRGQLCYSRAQRCNDILDCLTGVDELNCHYNQSRNIVQPKNAFDQFQNLWRHFDDGGWMWKNYYVKPDGRVDFRVKLPKIDTSWMIGAFAVGRDTGLSIMHRPATLSGIRRFFITVEMPEESVWGEQIGIRVAVFNYWNYWIEALVEIQQSDQYDVVWVEWDGFLYVVNSYSPQTVKNKTIQSLVYLQAGESKYIYFPVIPRNKTQTDFTICAYTFIGSNCEHRKISVKMNGVPNYYHTPVMLDLTLSSAEYVKNLEIKVPQMFWEPEARQLRYIPDSPRGSVAISGDVLGPTLSKYYKYATTESTLRRPDDACENVLFEFGYNSEILLYLRKSSQLLDEIRDNALDYIYLLLQRLMSYYNPEVGCFSEFREDKNLTNPFLAAFGIYALMDIEPLRKELPTLLHIPLEIISKLVNYLKSVQRDDGSFSYNGVRDRKFLVMDKTDNPDVPDNLRRVPVTAMVVLATSMPNVPNPNVASRVQQSAINFLLAMQDKIKDPFSIAITTYALMGAAGKSSSHSKMLTTLKSILRVGQKEKYWSNTKVPDLSTTTNKAGQIVINPRIEWPNDGYSTQTTALGILAYLNDVDTLAQANVSSITKWLQDMRNTDAGFTSTQDTFWAMKALRKVAAADRDRGIYALKFILKVTSISNFNKDIIIQRETLSKLHKVSIPTRSVWGEIVLEAEGTGRALMQLDVQMNVQENFQIKQPYQPNTQPLQVMSSFKSYCTPSFSGRNASIMHMKACGEWTALDLPNVQESGMAVFEIDLPTGYVVMNDDLRRYVQGGSVPTLRRALYRPGKIHFYFDKMVRREETCVSFRADRWYPVANMTLHYMCSLYEYYEPGRHNTTAYEAQSLFSNNICNVCGSFQCPYCPNYNVSTVLKFSSLLTAVCLLITVLIRRQMSQFSS